MNEPLWSRIVSERTHTIDLRCSCQLCVWYQSWCSYNYLSKQQTDTDIWLCENHGWVAAEMHCIFFSHCYHLRFLHEYWPFHGVGTEIVDWSNTANRRISDSNCSQSRSGHWSWQAILSEVWIDTFIISCSKIILACRYQWWRILIPF